MSDHGEICEQVFAAGRAMVEAGLVSLTFGNASVVDRAAGVMAIKPSGVPYEELTPAAVVIVELESGRVVGGGHRPSSDAPSHRVLYREFDGLGAIVHTHSRFATAWAQAGRAIPCLGTTHADHFKGPVPVTRALRPDEIAGDYEARTGDVIVETLRGAGIAPLDMPAVLVVGHGAFAWGTDAPGAIENAIALELVAELALNTLVLAGGTPALDELLLDRHFARKHGPGAYYGQGGA